MVNKLTDSKVTETLGLIEDKIKTLSTKKKVELITNANLEIFGKRYNLHTCQISELNFLQAFLQAIKNFSPVSNFVISGFLLNEWLKDVETLTEAFSARNQIQELQAMKSKLEKMISEETRNQMEFDKILKELE